MALIHRATLHPGKNDVLAAWLEAQPSGNAAGLENVGAYRFDDPTGRVGLETHLVRVGGVLWQIPLTYRDAALPDTAELARLQHSALGERWVYDGCLDPVYVGMLAAVTLTGLGQAINVIMDHDRLRVMPPTVRLHSAGGITKPVDLGDFGPPRRDADDVALLQSTAVRLRLLHRPRPAIELTAPYAITGTWAGEHEAHLLATAELVSASAQS